MNTIDSIDWGARLFGAAIVLGIMWWFGIVTYAHRYKPPPRKRKPVAIAGPAIVRKRAAAATTPARA